MDTSADSPKSAANTEELPVSNGAAISPEVPQELSSVDEVYAAILLKIIHGELVSGAILTSTDLARELGVSRTPVVAALDRLVADGIFQKERNRRAVVREGAENWLIQIHQLREMLEPRAAALAATRITDEQLDKLRKLADLAKPASNRDWTTAARQFDYALHLAIADSCGNLPLRTTLYRCWSFKRISYGAIEPNPANLEVGYREHLIILQALQRRDAETASAAMLFHLKSAVYLTADHGIV
jgi:DNA-binding GntR family transcriptional regulator